MAGMVYISRTEMFSACHKLESPHLSKEENKKLFGGYPAGNNYKVHVIIRGEIDPDTGMVMNLTDLKEVMDEVIMEPLDHKNLSEDVPYFKNTISSVENLVVFIWKGLSARLPEGILYEVRVKESEQDSAFYRGGR